VKSNDRTRYPRRGHGPLVRMLELAALVVYALAASVAQASTELVAATTLVSGSQTTVLSFQAPGPGTVSVQLTNLDWPQALTSLSFMAASASNVLSSWSDTSMSTQSASFQVVAGGPLFADITATAGGPLDLGAYSLALSFTPAAPVALPASGVLLFSGILGLLLWRRRTLVPPAAPAALQPAS
jgi:hypothetical protein